MTLFTYVFGCETDTQMNLMSAYNLQVDIFLATPHKKCLNKTDSERKTFAIPVNPLPHGGRAN